MIFLSRPRFAAGRSQACADCASLSAVERREAQPLSPKGARVPGQASQTCLVRRAERTLARSVGGASQAPGASRRSIAPPRGRGKEKGEAAYPRRENKEQGRRSVGFRRFLVAREKISSGLGA